NEKQNKSYASQYPGEGKKEAELSYRLLGKTDRYYFIEIKPKTGRHHQIRATMAALGCPIKGDIKYGAKRTNDNASIHLHARKLEFIHPTKKEPIQIVAPTPDDPIWNACLKLSGEQDS
ncbi:MAG: pseudouridine synthase, partial [Bacteroidota bacterium]